MLLIILEGTDQLLAFEWKESSVVRALKPVKLELSNPYLTNTRRPLFFQLPLPVKERTCYQFHQGRGRI